MKTVSFLLKGMAPLIMHNGAMADPTNPAVQELKGLTSKRKKTLEDHALIKFVEWKAGLYLNAAGEVVIPADNILAALLAGAKKDKNGKEVQAGVFESEPYFQLRHEGPAGIDALFRAGFVDYRGVRVQQARCMRARPRFNVWSTKITLDVETEIVELAVVRQALEKAGSLVGLGDYRPRFGRFTAE